MIQKMGFEGCLEEDLDTKQIENPYACDLIDRRCTSTWYGLVCSYVHYQVI